MSHRLTKEELDAQFEQFLKESVSDDSVDLGGADKQQPSRSSQKPTVSRWQDDEHSGGGSSREVAKRRFIKAKKSQPENTEAVSGEPLYKPVPKPRCKAPDEPIQSDKRYKDATTGHRAPSDESVSLSSPTHVSRERSPDGTNATPPDSTDSQFQQDIKDALLGSQMALMKSESIQEEDEKEEGLAMALLSRHSTETEDSTMAPDVNVAGEGLDTLLEEEEKARFFAQLEAGASSAIDYSKLNRELDSSFTTANDSRKAEEAEDDQSKVRRTGMITESPAFTGSPHYSEDFEDEDVKLEEKSKTSPFLARGPLYDSLDDTGGANRGKDTAESLDRGQPILKSEGSEMEALQEAYRQIHTVEDSDDRGHLTSSSEGRGRIDRPLSPSSSSQRLRQSLHPVSTNESELPTAEELMRPIRPEMEQMRGFTLQPVSAVEPDQEKTSRSPEKTFLDATYTKSQLKETKPDLAAAVVKGTRESTRHQTSPPQSPNREQTWSISEEADRLMQDHNKCSFHRNSRGSQTKKRLAFSGSTASHHSASSVGRCPVAPVRSRRVDGRTTVTSRFSGTSRGSATAAKTQSSVSCFSQHPQRAKSPKNQEKDSCDSAAEPGVKVSNELVASVQSLVTVLQQQIGTSNQQDAAQKVRETQTTQHLPQISSGEDTSAMEELRVQLALKERELQMMTAQAEELNLLRQQNYLESKLRSAGEASQKKRWVEAADPTTEEKFQQFDKELKEQEALIKGYQQENEKLYLQMKAQQAKSKANEEAMFIENQRLLNELASTREQLNKPSRSLGNVCLMDHTQHIADLLAQINTLQRNEVGLSEEIQLLKQAKQALEVDLHLMKKERDLAKAQAISTSGDKTETLRILEDKHREEVAALKKTLQWFAENQELLNKDAGRLKAATAEIHHLKEQVKKLNQEASKRSSTQQRKAIDKSVDMKRMQDLKQQVKELEQILRSRNPNSLPALIYAAATAAGNEDVNAVKTSPPGQITALLERRIQRLEAELESHDEEAKLSLRAMEQQFHSIKLRYEQQISELEQQLERKREVEAAAVLEPWISKVQTLEEELQRVKESHQQKEQSLHEQFESLQQQLKHKTQPSPSHHQHQANAAFGMRINRLKQELAVKARTIQELRCTVHKLQKERKNTLSVPNTRGECCSTESKLQQPGQTKAHCPPIPGEETFPTAQYEKTYQPTMFTGIHISEVLQENEALKQHVALLQLQSEQEKEALKANAAQAEQELCRMKDEFQEQLSTLKTEHLRALDQLRVTHALEHSSSKAAELANKLSTQEIAMKHLQEQLKELQETKKELKISRTREDTLQKQLTRLLQEVKEAKEAQSPEVKLLCSLERKILNMELKHQNREKELQEVIGGAWQLSGADQQSEVEYWRHLAQEKSRELEAFRAELDSILDILRHLQRQGVVLPPLNSPITTPFPQRS